MLSVGREEWKRSPVDSYTTANDFHTVEPVSLPLSVFLFLRSRHTVPVPLFRSNWPWTIHEIGVHRGFQDSPLSGKGISSSPREENDWETKRYFFVFPMIPFDYRLISISFAHLLLFSRNRKIEKKKEKEIRAEKRSKFFNSKLHSSSPKKCILEKRYQLARGEVSLTNETVSFNNTSIFSPHSSRLTATCFHSNGWKLDHTIE